MVINLYNFLISNGCYIREHFHIYCPGCGGTRALIALLNFDLLKSLYYNPLVMMLIIDFISIVILNITKKRNKQNIQAYHKANIVIQSAFLIGWLSFSIFRNYLLIFKDIDLLGDLSA